MGPTSKFKKNGGHFLPSSSEFCCSVLLNEMFLLFIKVDQVRALEVVYLGQDVIGVLPTGYGKS